MRQVVYSAHCDLTAKQEEPQPRTSKKSRAAEEKSAPAVPSGPVRLVFAAFI
jgi:hypothetical protein